MKYCFYIFIFLLFSPFVSLTPSDIESDLFSDQTSNKTDPNENEASSIAQEDENGQTAKSFQKKQDQQNQQTQQNLITQRSTTTQELQEGVSLDLIQDLTQKAKQHYQDDTNSESQASREQKYIARAQELSKQTQQLLINPSAISRLSSDEITQQLTTINAELKSQSSFWRWIKGERSGHLLTDLKTLKTKLENNQKTQQKFSSAKVETQLSKEPSSAKVSNPKEYFSAKTPISEESQESLQSRLSSTQKELNDNQAEQDRIKKEINQKAEQLKNMQNPYENRLQAMRADLSKVNREKTDTEQQLKTNQKAINYNSESLFELLYPEQDVPSDLQTRIKQIQESIKRKTDSAIGLHPEVERPYKKLQNLLNEQPKLQKTLDQLQRRDVQTQISNTQKEMENETGLLNRNIAQRQARLKTLQEEAQTKNKNIADVQNKLDAAQKLKNKNPQINQGSQNN